MSMFNKFFNKDQNLKECPRCLGKGHVDWDDIKRLHRELEWIPGMCAYCNGVGTVFSDIESNIAIDASYLVINLEEEERNRIINGDPAAIERAKQYEVTLNYFIDQITYLHFEGGLTPLKIANFFLIGVNDSYNYEERRKELIDYVALVIEKRARG